MRRLAPAFLLVSGVLLGSCTKELPLPAIEGEKRIVLLGEMIAGDTISLRGSISLPVIKGSTLQPELPSDLSLVVTSPTEPPVLITSGEADPDRKTVLLSAPQPVGAGSVYTLQASRPGVKDATAVVDIPQPFSASIIDTATVRYGGNRALRMTIRIRDRPGEKNFYTFEAVRQLLNLEGRFEWQGNGYSLPYDSASRALYDSLRSIGMAPHVDYDTTVVTGAYLQRLNTYTDDAATENIKLSSAVSPVRRVLLTDESFDGGTYDLRVYVDRSYFVSGDDINRPDLYSKGRVLFWVKSVSEDYFKYLRAYETFAPTTTIGTLAQPVRIEGNVTNGYGVVGGVYCVPFYYVFDRWPY